MLVTGDGQVGSVSGGEEPEGVVSSKYFDSG